MVALLHAPLVARAQRAIQMPASKAGAARAAAGAGTVTTTERAQLVAIAQLEDRRPATEAGIRPLVAALKSPSAHVRRVAVRALGRLQRPALASEIGRLLNDRDMSVRIQAANALAQALQGVRSEDVSPNERSARARLDSAVEALVQAAETAGDPALTGVVARSLGRLPFADSVVPRDVEWVIVQMAETSATAGAAARTGAPADVRLMTGVMHGLYALARSRRLTGAPSSDAVRLTRETSRFGLGAGGAALRLAAGEEKARVRRLALLTLVAIGDSAGDVAQHAARDPDEQVRRLAVLLRRSAGDTAERRRALAGALRDSSFLVRLEAVRQWRSLAPIVECGPILAALQDPHPAVMLAAIDALGGSCPERELVLDSLQRLLDRPVDIARERGHASWHRHAHALLALARVSPAAATAVARRDARHDLWPLRLYAARAATLTRDTATLSSLAYDPNGDVREAALSGLATTIGHLGDRVFVAGLSARDYQVVLTAANALQGAPLADSVVPALLAALDRLTNERRENARDPRVALVLRIQELGSARYAQRLMPYASDFDSAVAQRAATTLERWTMRRVAPSSVPLAPPADPIAEVVGGEYRMMVKMAATSGGGSFVVRLLPDDAPATVARIVRLARSGYYAGLTFHRVEPAFVIQGGSPAASEYVGDGPFMRDELGLRSHTRGTLGISTRGRDTGDAQLFVNLTDNFRLDHDYTVFGEIVEGRDVAEGILEGDVIERIDVVKVR